MPGPDQSIPSSLLEIFAVPPLGGTPLSLGIVEDFSATEQYSAENLKSLGKFSPPDNVVNNVEGRIRWGAVHTLNSLRLSTIRPQLQRYAQFRSFDILAVDPSDGRPIWFCRGVLPESLDTTGTNGRALREQYSGICREIFRGAEITAG